MLTVDIESPLGTQNKGMNKVCALLCLLSIALLQSQWHSPSAEAQQQKRKPKPFVLPKAAFPTYAQQGYGSGGGTEMTAGSIGGSNSDFKTPVDSRPNGLRGDEVLPTVNGVHLHEGLDRRPGTGVQPYDPGEPQLNMALVRWDTRKFPLKVWISEGKKLPSVPFEEIMNDRVPRVSSLLRTAESFEQLESAPGWKALMNDTAAEGFEIWRDLEREGVISFGYVDSPAQADVMVFFTDEFPGAAGPGGTDVHGNTCGQVFTAQQVQQKSQLHQPTVPIVIELKVNEESSKLRADAAHEFGHALGIKAHSPYRQDLMYVNRVVETLSPADKATLRALYRHTPKYWYY